VADEGIRICVNLLRKVTAGVGEMLARLPKPGICQSLRRCGWTSHHCHHRGFGYDCERSDVAGQRMVTNVLSLRGANRHYA